MSNTKKGFSPIILLIVIGIMGIGGTYYVRTNKEVVNTITPKIEENSSKNIPSTIQNEKSPTVSVDLEGGTTTIPITEDWTWGLYGCGSSAACSYEVVNSNRTLRYICYGKYDKSSTMGEKTPAPNENPQTTTNFNCSLLSN